MIWLPFATLVVLLAVAVATDIASRRIPNRLIVAGLAIGLLWQGLAPAGRWPFDPSEPGAGGLLASLVGATVLLLVFFPFYVLRVMGAGDVKLMAVIGAFLGATRDAWTQLVGVTICVLCAGGLLALLRMAWSRRMGAVWANLKLILLSYAVRSAGAAQMTFDPRTQSADRMPYALAIAAGTLFYSVGKWTGWLRLL